MLSQKSMALVCHTDWVASEHLISPASIPGLSIFFMKPPSWREASRHPAGKPLFYLQTRAACFSRRGTLRFSLFHNKLPESNKQAKSCHCLQLTVSGFAIWKQTAFCSLSCFSTVTLEAGRDQSQGPIPHMPLSPWIQTKEILTCLQEAVSGGMCK